MDITLEMVLLGILILIVAIALGTKLSALQQDTFALRKEIQHLREQCQRWANNAQTSAPSRPRPAEESPPPIQQAPPPVRETPPPPQPQRATQSQPETKPLPRPVPSVARSPSPPVRREPGPPAKPSLLEQLWQRHQAKIKQWATMAWQKGRRWLTGGNVPVKIGMLVLFAGIAALLNQLSAQGWLWVPLPIRLAGIGLLAASGLAFGWQQRHKRHNFALALQGGMIAILMFTLFAAYRLYALVPSSLALSGGILLMAAMTALAVVQRARVLTQLAIAGCFAAPLLMSSGDGSATGLFSYYALLDVTILGIAWIRPWRELNLLGFIFTYGIGVTKGVLDYAPEHWSITEPFLWLFFTLYLLLPLLYAYRAPIRLKNSIDASLVFGTPLITLVLQSSIVLNSDLALPYYVVALSAALMGAIYAVLATLCYRKWGRCLLSDVYVVLAATLATVAIPLAFGPEMTRYIFVIEGVGLVWLGLREQRLLPRLSGYGLQLYSALGLAFYIVDTWDAGSTEYLNAIALVAAAAVCIWLHYRAGKPLMTQYLYGYALFLWVVTHLITVQRWLPFDMWSDAFVILLAITACGLAWAYRQIRLPALLPAPAVCLVFCGLLTLPLLMTPATIETWSGSLVLMIAGTIALRWLGQGGAPYAAGYRTYFWLLMAARLSLSLIGDDLDTVSGSSLGLAMLPWLVLGAIRQQRPQWLALTRHRQDEQSVEQHPSLHIIVTLALAGLALLASASSCDAVLPWLPLLNPAELGQVAALALLWKQSTLTSDPRIRWCVHIGVAWLLNETLLHTLHHWCGIAWQPDDLLTSGVTQLSITLLWSAIGVIGWVTASRQRHHMRWRVYAIIMAVVLAKLLIVDRLYLGSLTGILSFVAYGLLCVLVGFLAPVPPHKATSSQPARSSDTSSS